ncbi:MAG: hypothetical protein IRZ18_08495, partial [Clostridia bacterium]|nr:hypothetical protein [Clostridia bacterium]
VGLVADGRGRPVPPGLQKPPAVRHWLDVVGALPGARTEARAAAGGVATEEGGAPA